jgi:hypothetical protein
VGGLVEEREAAVHDLDRQVGIGHERRVEVVHLERLHRHRAEWDRLVDRDHDAVVAGALEDRVDEVGVVHLVRAQRPVRRDVGLVQVGRVELQRADAVLLDELVDPLDRARLERAHAAVDLHALGVALAQLEAVLELRQAALEHPVHRDLVVEAGVRPALAEDDALDDVGVLEEGVEALAAEAPLRLVHRHRELVDAVVAELAERLAHRRVVPVLLAQVERVRDRVDHHNVVDHLSGSPSDLSPRRALRRPRRDATTCMEFGGRVAFGRRTA